MTGRYSILEIGNKEYLFDKNNGEYYLLDKKAEIKEGFAFDKVREEIRKGEYAQKNCAVPHIACDSHDCGSSVGNVVYSIPREDLIKITASTKNIELPILDKKTLISKINVSWE